MSYTATVELLSRYLDEDVSAPERERVERWLEQDGEVREIYEGLCRVRGRLAQLPEAAVPAHLEVLVRQQVALQAERVGLWRRFDRQIRRWLLDPSFLPALAVLMALAAMIYMLSQGIARFERASGPVIMSAPPASAVRSLAGRRFVDQGGRWVESGLEQAAVDTALVVVVPAGDVEEWARNHPDLAPVAEWGRVVIRLDEGVVEWIFTPRSGG